MTTLHERIERSRSTWPEHSFLANLTPPELEAFCAVGHLEHFRSGELLIEEGGPTCTVHLLLAPCVKVTAKLPEGGEALLAVRVAGDIVGELAALDGGPRLATVRACSPDPLPTLALSAEAFCGVLDANSAVARRVSGSMSSKLRSATRRRVDFSGFKSQVRLARILVDLAEAYSHSPRGNEVVLGVSLTQVELGTLAGVSEATVNRGLGGLRDAGLLVTNEARPIIRDLARLKALAQLT